MLNCRWMKDGFIPPHGGYQKLLAYQRSEIVYDATVKFCADLVDKRSRTVDQMVQDLERKKMFVEKFAFTEPGRYWHYLHHLFPMNPFLVCALDMAG